MYKPKYRNLIPCEKDPEAETIQSNYRESLQIGDLKNSVKLEISSIHTERSNFDVQGTFQYYLTNSSHFQIDAQLDFKNSSHIRIHENNIINPNRTLLTSHLEPFHDNPNNPDCKLRKKEEKSICKIQYRRGYIVNVNMKFAFTFPSLEQQRIFRVRDHEDIFKDLKEWKKYSVSQVEYLLMMNKPQQVNEVDKIKTFIRDEKRNKAGTSITLFYKKLFSRIYAHEWKIRNSETNTIDDIKSTVQLRVSPINIEPKIPEKTISFVDESFPPCWVDFITVDLSRDVSLYNPLFLKTEPANNNQKSIAFHYRSIEWIIPNCTQIFDINNNNIEIQYGLVKNQNIISVFKHLLKHNKFLSRLFPENNHNDIGIYKISLFVNSSWKEIYVDKFIPCFPLSFPIYTYSSSAYWPSLLEKALAKVYGGYDNWQNLTFMQLYSTLTGLPVICYRRVGDKLCENSNYTTWGSRIVNQSILINYMKENYNRYKKENEYWIGCFSSKENIKSLNLKNNSEVFENRIFPIKYIDDDCIVLNLTFMTEIENIKDFSPTDQGNNKYSIEKIFSFFDNFIIVKSDVYKELHFLSSFIRCQDYDIAEYERILAHTYYELRIKASESNINTTIVLKVPHSPVWESCYIWPEIDWKVGIISWDDKIDKNKKTDDNDIFNGKTPIHFETPDFVIGYSLVLDVKLHTGNYIIFPMTMGFSFQKIKNSK